MHSESCVSAEDWTKLEGMAAMTDDCLKSVLRLQAAVS